MFLNELPKDLINPYLSLAYSMMSADGILTEEEKSLFSLYATEMNLEELPKVESESISSILPLFDSLSIVDKKKFYFELYSLAYADSEVSKEEAELLEKIAKYWNLSPDVKERLERVVERLMLDYELLGDIINN